jgi:hypothetical protein
LEIVNAPISATMITDDGVAKVEFNAAEWFKDATDKEIFELAQQGWGQCEVADSVAEHFDSGNARLEHVARAFEYLHSANQFKTLGYACSVDPDEAMYWLERRRPKLFKAIQEEALTPTP